MSEGAHEDNDSSDSSFGTQRQRMQQLFTRIMQEAEIKKPSNPIYFIVDFLCKRYPTYLAGFANIWNGDPDLERERLQVVEFFRFQKLPIEIASQFTNAGYDTVRVEPPQLCTLCQLETLCTLTPESLSEVEQYNQTSWLPGHKVRLQQTFSDVVSRVRAYRQEREKLLHIARLTTGHCDHPVVVTRTNAPQQLMPAFTLGPNPMPQIRTVHPPPHVTTISPPPMNSVPVAAMPRPFVVTPMN